MFQHQEGTDFKDKKVTVLWSIRSKIQGQEGPGFKVKASRSRRSRFQGQEGPGRRSKIQG